MIKKIVAIRNVGRLEKCHAQGEVTFRKLTLIFAENGRGKTTLTDVLRSLSTGKGEHILGRKTLGTAFPPSVCVLVENDKAINFKDGAWDNPGPRLAIYDSTFVHENVYSGDHIDHDHKKNLYRVILGEEGVALARTVDDYDGKIREANREVAAKAAIVGAYMPAGLKLEDFLALEPDPEVDGKIASKRSDVAALKKSQEIEDKATLSTITIAELPGNFETCLMKVLDDISKDAEAAVKSHIGSHAKGGANNGSGRDYNTLTARVARSVDNRRSRLT